MLKQRAKVDTFLKDNSDIALLARQVEELMTLHNRLVAEGRVLAYKLMGLHNGYSANQGRQDDDSDS